MQIKSSCMRVLLARNAVGNVGFCEKCDVVEFELGATSLRIHAHELELVAQLVKEADARLKYYKVANKNYASLNKLDTAKAH